MKFEAPKMLGLYYSRILQKKIASDTS